MSRSAEEAHCAENVKFMETMFEFGKLPANSPPFAQYNFFRQVLRTYFSPSSPMQLNVSSYTQGEILHEWNLLRNQAVGPWDFRVLTALLEHAIEEVHGLVRRDFHKRFLKTEEHKPHEEEHKPVSPSDARRASFMGRARAAVADMKGAVARYGSALANSLGHSSSEGAQSERWPPALVAPAESERVKQIVQARIVARAGVLPDVALLDRQLLAGDADEAGPYRHPEVVPEFVRRARQANGAQANAGASQLPATTAGTMESLNSNCQKFLAKGNVPLSKKDEHLAAIERDLLAGVRGFQLDEGLKAQFLDKLAAWREGVRNAAVMQGIVREIQRESVPLPEDQDPSQDTPPPPYSEASSAGSGSSSSGSSSSSSSGSSSSSAVDGGPPPYAEIGNSGSSSGAGNFLNREGQALGSRESLLHFCNALTTWTPAQGEPRAMQLIERIAEDIANPLFSTNAGLVTLFGDARTAWIEQGNPAALTELIQLAGELSAFAQR